MKHTAWLSLFPLATLGCLIPLTVKAQVTPDGATSTTVNQDGNNFTIEQGDRLRGEYVNTDGSNAVDLSYSVSITVSNTTVGIKGGVTATEVVEEPFDRTDIEGFVAHYYYTDNIL